MFAVAAVAVALAVGMAAAQAPAGAPAPAAGISPECMNAVLNMSDCLSYVQSGSTARRPDKPCCPELAGLLESTPVCLCQLLAGGAESYGVSVDYKRALALPGMCRLSTPPVSACAGTHRRLARYIYRRFILVRNLTVHGRQASARSRALFARVSVYTFCFLLR